MINYSMIGGAIIRIFAESDFSEIEDAVAKLPTREGIEYTVTIREPSPELISYCDIVIIKWFPGIIIKDLKNVMRPESKLILCVKRDEEAQVQAEDFGFLADVWLYPFTQDRSLLRLGSLTEEILRKREADMYKIWLETLMDLVPDMVWFKSLSGAHLKVNKSFSHAAGKTRKMIEGKSHNEIWGGEDDNCAASEMEVLNSGQQRSFDEVIIINNVPHHLKTHKMPFRGTNGSIVGTLGVAQDLTNMFNLNLELGMFVEAMPFPLILTEESGKITHVNDKFLEMFKECRDDLIGAYYPEWSEWAFDNVSGYIGNIYRYSHDNDDLLIQFTETPLNDSFGQPIGMVLAFMDVTAEKEMESQIWKAANLDPLTGAASRHGFANWLSDNRSEVKHLFYLDLDNFKYVNDTYGHKAGDEVLCNITGCIREVFPEDFVARLGGDEFVVCICRDLDVNGLIALGEALQAKASVCFNGAEEFKKMSLSIGIKPHCEESAPIEKLIREADSAMYKAKRSGKGRLEVWTPEEN